jgi:hypothetical protein
MESIVINCLTNEQKIVQLSAEEISIIEKDKIEEQKRNDLINEQIIAKEAAQAKLAALGLTADDLKALGLGGN